MGLKLGIAVAFFVSGFCSLTYQVAWRKALSQMIGVDFYSTALVVAIFLLGLALGAEVGKLCLRKLDRPILGWLTAETVVSVFGLVSIPAIRAVPELSVSLGTGIGPSGYIADFVASTLLLLVPTIAMGVSFPIVVHYFRRLWVPGAVVGVLYSSNILGAAVGALGSGLLLVGTLGLARTVIFASILNMVQLAYILFLVMSKRDHGIAGPVLEPTPAAPSIPAASHTRTSVLGIAFVIGFVALLFEMAFVRMAMMYFSANNYVFPIVVFCYLLLMAFGNGIAAWFLNRGTSPLRLFNGLTIASCLFILLSLFMPHILTQAGLFTMREFDISLQRMVETGALTMLLHGLLLSFLMMLPVMAISGLFPVFVHVVTRDREELGANTGSIYFIQTIGNVSGAFIGGVVLLPAFGTITMLQVGGTAIVACAVMFMIWTRARIPLVPVLAMALGTVAMFSMTAESFYKHFLWYDGTPPSRVSEEVEGTAFLYDRNSGTNINIGIERATSYSHQNPYITQIDDTITIYDAVVQKPIERILIIGIGTGDLTLQLNHRFPKAKIVIVELLDVVIRDMKERGSRALKEVLAKSDIYITDGRRYVQRQAIPNADLFDLIQVGVFRPTSSGAGGLFTEEFQRRLRSILTPEGALSINAYMPAIKAGFHVFKKGIVYSRELGRQSAQAMFFNNDETDIEAGLQRYASILPSYTETMRNTANLRTFVPDWYLTADDPRYFFPGRASVLKALEGVAPQTDDLPATEYYLNQQTTWSAPHYYATTKRDLVYWEWAEGAYALDGSFGRDVDVISYVQGDGGGGEFDVPRYAISIDLTRSSPTLDFNFTEPRRVRGYQIMVDSQQSSLSRYPLAWSLEGSNDGQDWTRLHEVVGFTDWRGVRGGRVYPKYGRIWWFANEEAFRLVRLQVTETVGGDKPPMMTEVRLFGRSVFGHPIEHVLPRSGR